MSSTPVFGSTWIWADDIDATALRRMAQVTRELFTQPERWIHRRVERVYFKNHHLAHHQISVDFTLPAGLPVVGTFDNNDVYIAPLFLMVKGLHKPPREGKQGRRRFLLFGKRRLVASRRPIPTAPYSNIDFRDENGRTMPLVTHFQTSLLAETMLLETAEGILKKPVTGKLKEQISAIPYRGWSELQETLTWLFESRVSCCDPRTTLRKEREFCELAYIMASHSMIVCLFLDGPQRRSVYKLSYDEQLNEGFSVRWGGMRRSFGWKSEQYSVPLNEIGASASYHVEIEVPKELTINAVSLVGKRYRWFGELLTRENRDYSIQQIGSASNGKIYVPEPLAGRRVGLTWVKLRLRRSEFLVGALVASIVIALALTLVAFIAPTVARESESESATAALLLLPVLLAGYIVRSGEHPIAARMLWWARTALVIDGMLPAIAVFILLGSSRKEITCHSTGSGIPVGPITLPRPWLPVLIIAAASLLFVLLFSISTFLPIPHGKTVYEPMPKERARGV